jgi:hypothetical protein
MSKLRDEIRRLGHEFEQESAAAFELWTWLPSHKAAEKSHGDYASEHTPSPANVMREAAIYMAELKGHAPDEVEVEEWYGCPCGECENARGKPSE